MGLPLVIENVTWSFTSGSDAFLRVPYLEVDEGQMVAVVGPSGAGKSSLLFLLAGLEVPTAGTLLWGGHNMASDGPGRRDRWRRKNLGLVFQDFQLIPELSAWENVLLPLTFDHFWVSVDERQRARLLLEQMGVERPLARASTLSRGEMQRTALARALMGRPAVLLADEPTASLDARNEDGVVHLLRDYRRESGATVIVSTHQQALQASADLVLHLSHGALAQEKR